jgi:hypothetical protein
LDQLLAPIALYPDPLISLILPAATFAPQVQDAAGFLQGGGDPSQIDAMGWDASVQGLAHYPEVIAWLSANFDWTQQLGGAFASQPAAVMDAIQDLRQRAQAAGTLVSTPQQQVIIDGDTLAIVPVQPSIIYVPQYDPAVVYVQQPPGFYPGPYFSWSQPYPAGTWLSFDFDWRNHAVYQGDWYDYRQQHGGWSRPIDYSQVQINVTVLGGGGGNRGGPGARGYSAWHPPHNAPPAPPQLAHRGSGVAVSAAVQARFAQPHVMKGTPSPPPGAARVNALVVNRGERPPQNAPKAHLAPARPPAAGNHPATPAAAARPAPPVRANPPPNSPSADARAEQEQAAQKARDAARAQQQRAQQANAARAAQASQERAAQTRPAPEPARSPAAEPANRPPAPPTPKAPPPKKKPAPPTKEEIEREQARARQQAAQQQ